ncbi:MAG: hypothetical protein IPK83_21670 [Planctomycetes bacterium]|nr:hypothetical protein [Planctomycetota bacterium]
MSSDDALSMTDRTGVRICLQSLRAKSTQQVANTRIDCCDCNAPYLLLWHGISALSRGIGLFFALASQQKIKSLLAGYIA